MITVLLSRPRGHPTRQGRPGSSTGFTVTLKFGIVVLRRVISIFDGDGLLCGPELRFGISFFVWVDEDQIFWET